jgi:hypothetical protein
VSGERSELVRGDTGLVLKAVERAAEDWGAGWQAGIAGGRLELPVSAGLRHGRMSARLDLEGALAREGVREGAGEDGPRTRVVLRPERAEYHLWTPAVVILVVAVAGALLTVVWPFFPKLLPLAPFGAILGLSAWLLIVTRLQNRGPEEFLALVAGHAGQLLESGTDDGRYDDQAPESME